MKICQLALDFGTDTEASTGTLALSGAIPKNNRTAPTIRETAQHITLSSIIGKALKTNITNGEKAAQISGLGERLKDKAKTHTLPVLIPN